MNALDGLLNSIKIQLKIGSHRDKDLIADIFIDVINTTKMTSLEVKSICDVIFEDQRVLSSILVWSTSTNIKNKSMDIAEGNLKLFVERLVYRLENLDTSSKRLYNINKLINEGNPLLCKIFEKELYDNKEIYPLVYKNFSKKVLNKTI